MKHLPLSEEELTRRAVREAICPNCYQRPSGSEHLGPDAPRACEPACTIFLNLPSLQSMVSNAESTLDWPEKAIRETVCLKCSAAPSAGDFCSEGLNRTCPLSRYSLYVLDLFSRLHDRHRARSNQRLA